MNKLPTLSVENKRLAFPVTATLVWWMFLKFIGAADIWLGVYYTIFGIVWLATIAQLIWDAWHTRKSFRVTEGGEIEIE